MTDVEGSETDDEDGAPNSEDMRDVEEEAVAGPEKN